MFPLQVERLVVLDLLCFSPLALPQHVPAARHAVLQTLATVRRMERPVQPRYSRQEAVTRALAASNSLANQHLAPAEHAEQITRTSVETLLRRGLVRVEDSASKRSIRRFVITEKAPTRAFSWLKAATTAFTFKTLLRH